jgi:hypothetical protein
MHTLIIEKATSLILQSRYDNSTGEKMPIAQVLEAYCNDTSTVASTVEIVEIPPQKFNLTIGKHVYQNGQILVSPTWIEPSVVIPAPEQATEPNAE